MEDENVRLFQFHVPGYIPGLPRHFSGGSQAYVNIVTLKVVAEGPLNQPLSLPLSLAEGPDSSPEPAIAVPPPPPAPVGEVNSSDSGAAASSSFSFIPDAEHHMGG